MKLTVNGIGKIRDTEINLDGITVIAGPNNTGKSTLGKALFALVDAQYDFTTKVNSLIIEQIERALRTFSDVSGSRIAVYIGQNINLAERMNADLSTLQNVGTAEVYRWLRQNESKSRHSEEHDDDGGVHFDDDYERQLFHELSGRKAGAYEFRKACSEILSQTQEQCRKRLAANQFTGSFKGQFASLLVNSSNESSVSLSMQDKALTRVSRAKFIDSVCVDATTSLGAQYVAIMVNDPDKLISALGQRNFLKEPQEEAPRVFKFYRRRTRHNYETSESILVQRIRSALAGNSETSVSNKVEKAKPILDLLDTAHRGLLKFDENERLVISEDSLVTSEVIAANASMGVKAVELIKEILRRNCIDSNTFLIFDEPEIHLHPEWQIIYAKALVIISKIFDTKILVTTHSPYFAEALYAYSKALDYEDKKRVYVPEVQADGSVIYRERSGIMETDVFDAMARPFDELENVLDAARNSVD